MRAGAPIDSVQRGYAGGVHLEQQGRYEQALGIFQDLLASDPRYFWSAREAGNCEYHLGAYAEAISYYDRYLKANPGDLKYRTFVGSLRLRLGAQVPGSAGSPEGEPSANFEFELGGGIVPFLTNRTVVNPNGYTLSNGGETLAFSGFNADNGSADYGGVGGGTFGWMANSNLSLIATLDYDAFSQQASDTYLNGAGALDNLSQTISLDQTSLAVLLGVKYRFGSGGIRPYLLAQAGASSYTTSVHYEAAEDGMQADATASHTAVAPAFTMGLGVEFPVWERINMFLQGQFVVVNVSALSEAVPVDLSGVPAGTTASHTSFSVAGATVVYVPLRLGVDWAF